MKIAWQAEAGSLACNWAEALESGRSRPDWLQEASTDVAATPQIPDFAAHSPLGSGEWIVPWNARWSVLTRSWD
jgi:hypothetical protein